MQFYGKTQTDGYLTDVSTNSQDGFNQYTIQDKYAPFLNQYYDKMRVINGVASVPDNLPITQFEQEKADWEAQISQDKSAIQNQLDNANQTIDQLTQITTKAQEAVSQTSLQVANMQKMLMQIQRANLTQQSESTNTSATASSSAQPTK